MYKEFVKNGKNPIYEADQFRRFCQAAGAQSLFDDILSSVTNPRHSENRLKLNEKRVVGIIYNLVYCLKADFQSSHEAPRSSLRVLASN